MPSSKHYDKIKADILDLTNKKLLLFDLRAKIKQFKWIQSKDVIEINPELLKTHDVVNTVVSIVKEHGKDLYTWDNNIRRHLFETIGLSNTMIDIIKHFGINFKNPADIEMRVYHAWLLWRSLEKEKDNMIIELMGYLCSDSQYAESIDHEIEDLYNALRKTDIPRVYTSIEPVFFLFDDQSECI